MTSETPVLTLIQNELKAPKSQENKFGKYKYRTCEDILEALKPILKIHNAELSVSDQIELIGDRYYVKATCRLFFGGNNVIEASAYAREGESQPGMAPAQITGSTSSYARKYALNGLFLIDDTKDADSQEPVKETKKVEPAKPKKFQAMIDKVFENPDEKSVNELFELLLKEKAPIRARKYFDELSAEFYHKQSKLIAETL